MSDGHCDLDNDAYRAGYQDAASAVRKAVLEMAIEALSGEIKGVTLGDDLIGKIDEMKAIALMDAQRKIDIAVLQQLIDKDVSCNLQEQADKSVSAPPLQSGFGREAWQPIQTAPNDGRQILTYDTRNKPEAAVCLRHSDGDFWRREKVGPTHWMALPAPPQQDATGEAPSSQTLEAE